MIGTPVALACAGAWDCGFDVFVTGNPHPSLQLASEYDFFDLRPCMQFYFLPENTADPRLYAGIRGPVLRERFSILPVETATSFTVGGTEVLELRPQYEVLKVCRLTFNGSRTVPHGLGCWEKAHRKNGGHIRGKLVVAIGVKSERNTRALHISSAARRGSGSLMPPVLL